MNQLHSLLVVALTIASTSAAEPTLLKRLGSERFRQHERVEGIAYSPDGKQLATSDSENIHFWDTTDGRLIRSTRVENHKFYNLQFSAFGRTLCAFSLCETKMHLVQVATDTGRVRSDVCVHDQTMQGKFSPNGAWLAQWQADGKEFQVLNTGTGRLAWKLPYPDGRIYTVTYSPDGKTVAVGTLEGWLHILDLVDGTRLHEYQLEGGAIWNMAYSADGKDLVAEVSSPGPNHVARFETATGKYRWRLDAVRAKELIFAADGKAVLFYGNVKANEFEQWRWLDATTGNPFEQAMNAEYGHEIAHRPDSKVMAVGGFSGLISQWDLVARKRLDNASADPPTPVRDLRFSADGSKVLGWSSGLYEWDVATGKQTLLTPGLKLRPSDEATISADQKWLAVARLVGLDGGNAVHTLELMEVATGRTTSLGGIRDRAPFWFLRGGRLAVIGDDGLTLYEPSTGKAAVQIAAKRNEQALSIGHDETRCVVVTPNERDLKIEYWSLETGRRIDERTLRFDDPAYLRKSYSWEAMQSSDGRILAVFFRHVAFDGGGFNDIQEVRTAFFDVRTGRQISGYGDMFGSSDAIFSPDGRMVACFSRTGLGIEFREVTTGKRRTRIAVGSGISDCCFSSDGKLLAMARSPGPIEIWSVAGQPAPWQPSKANDLWNALVSEEADVAYAAIGHLQAHPTGAVPLLRSKVKLAVAPAADAIASRIKDLDAADFRKREKATTELAEFGELVLLPMRDALTKASPEARERLTALIPKAEAMSSEKLRAIRACEVLEWIATAEAKSLLAEWAKGPPSATLTREANESLGRLKRRGD